MWRMVFLLALVLAACGRAEVDVQVADPAEATALHNQQATQQPNADDRLFYQQARIGLYFHYPATWQVEEQADRVTLSGDGLRLVIAYGTHAPDPGAPVQAGAIDASLVESDSVLLLGDPQPTYLDETARRLYYTFPDETVPFLVANIGFSIWLEAGQWPPAPQVRQLADAVVASIGFEWLVTRPPADQIAAWNHYTDEASGLQFNYPANWQVSREPDAIIVAHPDARLILALSGGPSGLPAGELRKGAPSHIWLHGTAVPRVHLVYNEQVKAVFYGQPANAFPVGDLMLGISVIDTGSVAYEALDLSPDLLRQMDWIVTTLQS